MQNWFFKNMIENNKVLHEISFQNVDVYADSTTLQVQKMSASKISTYHLYL